MKWQLAFVFGIFLSLSSHSTVTVPDCSSKPDFISDSRRSPNLKTLPAMAFVARKAEFYVENKEQTQRIWGEQSFVKSKPRIVCAHWERAGTQGFSMYAPTLLDLRPSAKGADVYWQFQVTASDHQYGIWNQKSRLFSKVKDLESALLQMGAQMQIYQISHEQFELVFTRETSSWVETLSVTYDGLLRIP